MKPAEFCRWDHGVDQIAFRRLDQPDANPVQSKGDSARSDDLRCIKMRNISYRHVICYSVCYKLGIIN